MPINYKLLRFEIPLFDNGYYIEDEHDHENEDDRISDSRMSQPATCNAQPVTQKSQLVAYSGCQKNVPLSKLFFLQ